MLCLHSSYLGFPAADWHSLALPHETLLLYPSADAVVITNALSLELVKVLAFWEAFPGSVTAKDSISCLSVDSGMKIIVAAMKSRIASWALSDVHVDSWRIHSSMLLPVPHTVVSMDSKSGLLAVGSESHLFVYTLILENDLPTWSQKWGISLQYEPTLLRFSHSLMYIAVGSKSDNILRLYSTASGRLIQSISHTRPITDIVWRSCQTSTRDDLILYTVTSDSTLRIFLPVLDSPQQLQLHASLNLLSALPFSIVSAMHGSTVFSLDRQVMAASLRMIASGEVEQMTAHTQKLKELQDEDWDLFIHALPDGSIVLSALTDVDRRPPTLLKHFTLHQSIPSLFPKPPSRLRILSLPKTSSLCLVTSSPLAAYELSPADFFNAPEKGLSLRNRYLSSIEGEHSQIIKFVRSPEGRGLGVVRSDGGGEVWKTGGKACNALIRAGSWEAADQVVIFEDARAFVTYSSIDSVVRLHSGSGSFDKAIPLPPLESLIMMPSLGGHDSLIGITEKLELVHLIVLHGATREPSLHIQSQSVLPVQQTLKMILPVDPMGWGMGHGSVEHDLLLSVSNSGDLMFWVPAERSSAELAISNTLGWRCTGKVRTERTGIIKARCSSAKKTVLVVPRSDGEELTIWDSKESEFASGLEYRRVYSEHINDLDWTSTPDMQSILAVGFLHHVELLCEQRMTYFDEGPGWETCWRIQIGSFVPYPITDSIWLSNGSLLVGAGHQMFLYSSSPTLLSDTTSEQSLFEYVARQNGPLADYHPQMLLQCLLWDKLELVKDIIINLSKDLEQPARGINEPWTSVPIERFISPAQCRTRESRKVGYSALFDSPDLEQGLDEEGFTRELVMNLIECLETRPLPHLTPNEQAHLLVLIQTTLEIDEQSRSLDSNGLRYLISMRSFYILNRRASVPASPVSNGTIPRQTGRRERLRYRDMIWAFHSESQDLLLNASTAACNGRMCWSDARALGISIWLNSSETLKAQLEIIARNEYMANEGRNPIACSLFYFALGKVKLVHGLWRQAVGHKEQAQMLKFLANDFSEPRWRTAALKNAFALLGKRRFEYAAAFFLLGSALQDAINVCLKQLRDFQLAIALARIVEPDNEGPILQSILNTTVLPIAFKEGNRWLASWAFWLLHRRDLAVRIIITPLQDIAATLNIRVDEVGEPHYDDPSLALLFSQLRLKTLQAAHGTSQISGRSEFNFVLQIARVFCRMGCHALALNLVRSWGFERPSPVLTETGVNVKPTGGLGRRLAIPQHIRRRSSMIIDMDIPSLPPTRPASPRHSQPAIEEEQEDGDLLSKKAGLGDLMKSAKNAVKVAEFDINAFF